MSLWLLREMSVFHVSPRHSAIFLPNAVVDDLCSIARDFTVTFMLTMPMPDALLMLEIQDGDSLHILRVPCRLTEVYDWCRPGLLLSDLEFLSVVSEALTESVYPPSADTVDLTLRFKATLSFQQDLLKEAADALTP